MEKYIEIFPEMSPEEEERYERICALADAEQLPSKDDTRFLLMLAKRSIKAGSRPEPKVRALLRALEVELRKTDEKV
jgi:hypothetical protein